MNDENKTQSRGSGDFSIGSKFWPGISKLIEECGEAIQVAGKLLGSAGIARHWDGSDLRERLEEEIGDVIAAYLFVIETNNLNWRRISARRDEKLELFRKWHEEQGEANRS